MASDLPDEAVEAVMVALTEELKHWGTRTDRELQSVLLAAAAPHIRAQVLAEVDAALRDDTAFWAWYDVRKKTGGTYAWIAADYLRDTLGAGGEGDPDA